MGIIIDSRLQAIMTQHRDFDLMLFSTNVEWIQRNVAAGVSAVIVDWERNGKHARQAGADTQIGIDTLADLERVRSATTARLICRVNSFSDQTAREVDDAISAGAEEILLPMVRDADEVDRTLGIVDDRCGVGVLIETVEAVANSAAIAKLPIIRAYMGLNDLAIARQTPSIFSALVDGTIEQVRPHFSMSFGFGGLTVPDRGEPVPCRLLMGLMTAHTASFSFLRRSYHRDMRDRDPAAEIPRILAAIESAERRGEHQRAHDLQELAGLLAA